MRFSETLHGIGNPVAYYPGLARVVGGVTSALFLCQINFWGDKGHDPDGWIYKTQEDMTNETGLTRTEQETARRNLKKLGILEERHARLEHRLYYRINDNAYRLELPGEFQVSRTFNVSDLSPYVADDGDVLTEWAIAGPGGNPLVFSMDQILAADKIRPAPSAPDYRKPEERGIGMMPPANFKPLQELLENEADTIERLMDDAP